MQLYSAAFENGEFIPPIFTCDGKDINPPLSITDVPKDAQSLALIMEDPDAPGGTFTHWTMWNMPSNTAEIPEGGFVEGVEGITSSKGQGYVGPCPPGGTHRYIFNLFALDTTLDLGADTDRETLEAEMAGHILEKAQLQSLYKKQ